MSNEQDDGGPVFPTIVHNADGSTTYFFGISRRDWFAGQALSGTLANLAEVKSAQERAQWAYCIADAMLAARKAKP